MNGYTAQALDAIATARGVSFGTVAAFYDARRVMLHPKTAEELINEHITRMQLDAITQGATSI